MIMYIVLVVLAVLCGALAIWGWMIIGSEIGKGKHAKSEYLTRLFVCIGFTLVSVFCIVKASQCEIKTKTPPNELLILRNVTITMKGEEVKRDTVYVYKFKE